MRRLVAAVVAACLVVAAAGIARGYWSAGSQAGGSGAAAAAAVNQGATPSASAAGSTVTVSWAATTLSNGAAVDGFVIKRYDAGTLAPQAILSACTGTISGTSCTENSVGAGDWVYTVTPVFATNWRGAESAMSSPVTVAAGDTTAPVNSITLSDVSGGAHKSGDTVYYRGAAAGSYTLTNAVTDAGSGPASSTTATLTGTATGWSHPPSTVTTPSGGPYVSAPFSWTAGTTSSPGEAVTGRDVAGNAATTTLAFVDDSTAPGSGTLTYNNGYTPGRSVTLTFAAGTDSGSGAATGRLQRASATLTGGTCGSFTGFANVGPLNPASPYSDTNVTNSACYRYQYVVTDNVGNAGVTTSANVAKVDYAGAVGTTTGALSHWRLGEATISRDSMTGTTGTLLTAHADDLGATWTHWAGASNAVLSNGRTRKNGTGYSWEYVSATPASADYAVEADFYRAGVLADDDVGIFVRGAGSGSFYVAEFYKANDHLAISKYVNGVWNKYVAAGATGSTTIGTGTSTRVRLEVSGGATTTLKLYRNGSLHLTGTDDTTPLTAAGLVGVFDGDPAIATLSKNDARGVHLDNFWVTPRAADSKGTNTGGHVGGALLGEPGALANDADTAVRYDGVNDYTNAVDTTGIPVGAEVRSTELWFKTSFTMGQTLFAYGTLGDAQAFGLWLNDNSAGMTAWGWGAGHDKTYTLNSPVTDGAWHHLVQTYDGTSLQLYVDGTALPAQAATRNTGMHATGFGIGAVLVPGDPNTGKFFNGTIDEVSFYTSVLDQATVTNHRALGIAPAVDSTGPTGGSVAASGLVGTGSQYSTSTTLSLDLAKGTDPSGLATSGAQLLRASASLTSAGGTADGVCGAFGSYALVATDPVSPRSDSVGNAACYRYQYVVEDVFGNSTTYTSPDIKVDSTGPAAPTYAFSALTGAYWSGAGSTTVYYRPAASSGSFTATATATDAASGVASYTFPALGSGWTSTPGALGVNTYSWTGTPAVPGSVSGTATNNATVVSPAGPFTVTADSTAPTDGTITYADGAHAGTSLSVSFTTGTDGGSGVGTRLLQRATASLSGGTCGAFGAFATVTGGTNPTSPHVDTVSNGVCYMYQYVVSDNVGNTHTATSANVVKVTSYSDTILGTTGLLSYWRLGEANMSADSFTGSAGAILTTRAGELGATWTRWVNDAITGEISNEGRLRKTSGTTGGVTYYTSATPASPDYQVSADVHVKSLLANDYVVVIGRKDLTDTVGNGTHYHARYNVNGAQWELRKDTTTGGVNSGTLLGSFAETLTAGQTYSLTLDMRSSSIRMLVNGIERAAVTDTSVSGAGRGGVRLGSGGADAAVTDAAGLHLDNFRITPVLRDSQGSRHGWYLDAPVLGASGAIANDADGATEFSSGNDHVRTPRQMLTDFSVEFWFKSTQGMNTGPEWYNGAALVDNNSATAGANDWGISLRSDGRVVAGAGNPTTSIMSTNGGFNDGSWHHVVFTRASGTGAMVLYVDGVEAASVATGPTGDRDALTDITFGAQADDVSNDYVGDLDEVAIYNSVLSAATVAAHRDAAR